MQVVRVWTSRRQVHPGRDRKPALIRMVPVTLCSRCRAGIPCGDGDRLIHRNSGSDYRRLIRRNGGSGYGDGFMYGNCSRR